MRTTAWLNQKGGVGKSAGVAGTAGALMERGRRVLAVDMDPQGHLTTEALRLTEAPSSTDGETAANLANRLTDDYTGPARDLLVQHSTHASGGELWVIPTSLDMFLLVKRLYSTVRAAEYRLARFFEDLAGELDADEQFDHVLVDCPPELGITTDNALAASDGLLIPVQPERTSIRALRLLLLQIAAMEHELRLAKRDVHGLVASVFRRPLADLDRYIMSELERLEEENPSLAVRAHLALTVKVREAWMYGTPVPQYAPRHEISDQYRRIAVLLDVAAGLVDQTEWDTLPALPRVHELEATTT